MDDRFKYVLIHTISTSIKKFLTFIYKFIEFGQIKIIIINLNSKVTQFSALFDVSTEDGTRETAGSGSDDCTIKKVEASKDERSPSENHHEGHPGLRRTGNDIDGEEEEGSDNFFPAAWQVDANIQPYRSET